MACEGLMNADILFDCDNSSVAGLEVDVILVNSSDIDVTALTYSPTNKLVMTNFQLMPGKVGFTFQGVKQVNSSAWELVKKEMGPDKKKHIFNGVILNLSAANKLQLEQMSEGGKYVAIVERKWKGALSADAFEVYGINSGLELNVATYNSKENDGTATIELSSTDGYEESKIPLTLLHTDYATTKTAMDNKFIEAAI